MEAESKVYYNYPFPAIEELLSNAVYHKSYEIDCPITMTVYNDRIEITSFPGFDRSISREDIINHNISSKIYRNRRIGDFLKELKLIEGRNTGYPRIYDALKNNGLEDLQINMDDERRYVSITISINQLFINDKNIDLSEYEQRVVDSLRQMLLNTTEISKCMGYKFISKKLTDTVSKLCDKKIILKTFGNKYSISEITTKGGIVTSTIKTDMRIVKEGK